MESSSLNGVLACRFASKETFRSHHLCLIQALGNSVHPLKQYGKWPIDGTWLDAVPASFQHFLDSLSNWTCGWSLGDRWELTGIACCRKLNIIGRSSLSLILCQCHSTDFNRVLEGFLYNDGSGRRATSLDIICHAGANKKLQKEFTDYWYVSIYPIMQ